MKIYNTITKNKEEFKPIEEGKVSMYVCGPTVYGLPHVGHAKSYVFFDVVYRYLTYLGYKVKYVQNITDVGHLVGDGDTGEDKIERMAKKEQVDPYEIAYYYENKYFDAMEKLNVKKPTISSRATGNIPEIIAFIDELIKKGYAYVTEEGNVYYDITKFKNYGKLSNRSLDETLSGQRITVADDKRNPSDFALWKKAVNGHIMKWNSPWSIGYPGWHIECSTMIRKFLGNVIDIHGGGMDNVFPHHECELAQSTALNGNDEFVHYFIHNNLVTVNGQKMGKSLNNFVTLDDLFNDFDPMVIRFYLLNSYYRKPTDFSNEKIEQAKLKFIEISDLYNSLLKIESSSSDKNDEIEKNIVSFKEALDEDFNTPLAISYLYEINKIINKLINNKDYKYVNQVLDFYNDLVIGVLGLNLKVQEKTKDTEEVDFVKYLNELREKMRNKKEYEISDEIRDFLIKNNIDVHDKQV